MAPTPAPPAPGTTDSSPQASGGQQLSHGLKQRHLSMIALGGVIGAGLFVGSGAGIAAAGPAIILAFTLSGLLVMLIMRMLGEMSAARPASGSFSVHAEKEIGPWAGITAGWMYWVMLCCGVAAEATAAGKIVNGWIPGVSSWVWVGLFMVFFCASNLTAVKNFGEFEFWFAGIKVVAIAAFLVIGTLAAFGLMPGTHAVGTSNLTGQGGFLPHGVGAVFTGMLTVVFAFMGSEIVTLAAGESEDPEKAVSKATNSVIWRIGIFYLGSILLVVTLLPWNSAEVKASPYVAVLDHVGIPHAGQVMDVIVLTAVLSCLNSGMYTASRMAFSLGQRGDAPKAFATVTSRGVPRVAILSSVVFGFVAVFFNYTSPKTVFAFLLNSSGAIALFVWLVICATQLRMRKIIEREMPERHTVRMWLYPYLTWFAIGMIGFVVVYMFTDHDGRQQMYLSLVAAAIVLGASA
ncbi:amino acid permease, partial [Nocardiopsis alba]|uniref:amino acid permease n=1 Tax=Nocardiopsis alba TaxID=53437 RepID=UPI0033F318DD